MATNSSSGNIAKLNEVIVAIIPFPKYSHLNQLIKLASYVASHNIRVHFLSHADRNHDLKLRIKDGPLRNSNINFEDFSVDEDTSVAAGDGLPAVAILVKKLSQPIRRKCLELSTNAKKLVIIYEDAMRTSIGDVFTFQNVESYAFNPISVFSSYSMLREINRGDILIDDEHEEMCHELQDDFPTIESCFGPYVKLMSSGMERDGKLNSGELIYSLREMEGKYLDLVANNGIDNKAPIWAAGSLNMLLESKQESSNKRTHHECLEFLDKQVANSVILVSFGTTTTFSQEQVHELALGLEQSNHSFIWVLRKADDDTKKSGDGDGKIELPEGFEERVERRGVVVRNWLPQLEIMGHPSIGGIMSHCGWSSCIESISKGVPFATWPLYSEQPYNAILVNDILKIGIPVRGWARRKELVTASTIEKAIKTLIGSPAGEEMRQRAKELSKKIKSSVIPGGLAHQEMESFISYITK